MSYAGEGEGCRHDGGRGSDPNCTLCIWGHLEKIGVRDAEGVLHAPNGGGRDAYCVGHIEKDPRWPDGDGRCTVLVRHCPVLNTPEQVRLNLLDDARAKALAAERKVNQARYDLALAEQALQVATSELEDVDRAVKFMPAEI